MKFTIKHEIPGRLRVHLNRNNLTFKEADTLQYYLESLPGMTKVVVYERTADATITFKAKREEMITALRRFHFEEIEVPAEIYDHSFREVNAYYKDKLITSIMVHYTKKWFLPTSIRTIWTMISSVRYFMKGTKALAAKKLDVSVLDAIAIGAAMVQGNFSTAGSVMFLLGIGETMEEWTHKKSVSDLAQSMSLNIENVWLLTPDHQEVLVPITQIEQGDHIVVRMGNVIPFDGNIVGGEGAVNQASLTGEAVAVHRTEGGFVYAGTVLEDGELIIKVNQTGGKSRYDRIVSVIEKTEKLKSSMESRTEHLADKLVPYTLAGTALVGLLTRNVTKAMAVLMVDFSCALKLAMPITVLSAIREASKYKITVKGGKFLENMAEATTIVFDKTGTLTKAQPTLVKIISVCDQSEDELLKIAACLEEHFPHSMAKAVVKAAEKRNINHKEMHSKIEYIVAHGISSRIGEKDVIIGSYHFVFEDEHCRVLPEYENIVKEIPDYYSILYMAIEKQVVAILCIEDPVREEAGTVLSELRELGFKKIVMMTGDSKRTAEAVASRLGLDGFYAEVLPEDKSEYVLRQKEKGHKVVMIGDGINDSPALSAADVGIAISDGAEIAKEIADITISSTSLDSVVKLKKISNAMMNRINKNFAAIVGINGSLIGLGVAGVITPTASATCHNLSTIGISLSSMSDLLPEEDA